MLFSTRILQTIDITSKILNSLHYKKVENILFQISTVGKIIGCTNVSHFKDFGFERNPNNSSIQKRNRRNEMGDVWFLNKHGSNIVIIRKKDKETLVSESNNAMSILVESMAVDQLVPLAFGKSLNVPSNWQNFMAQNQVPNKILFLPEEHIELSNGKYPILDLNDAKFNL